MVHLRVLIDTFPLPTGFVSESTEASKGKEAALARTIFADITKFSFPPFIQSVVDEMVRDANKLISFYALKEA